MRLLFLFLMAWNAQADVIHMMTAEVRGLFGTGGLQHATLDKAKFLVKAGHDVRLIVPYYTSLNELRLKKRYQKGYQVQMNQGQSVFDYDMVEFPHPEVPEVKVVAVQHKPGLGFGNMFENITADGRKVYTLHPNETESFAFYCKAYVNWIDAKSARSQPDVVILNDWHTGAAGAYLKERKERILNRFSKRTRSLQGVKVPYVQGVIHNLKYQGVQGRDFFNFLDLDEKYFSAMDMGGNVNLLKNMMETSDYVETVSMKYASEITSPQFAEGLESVTGRLAMEGRLSGLINGIDPEKWNPQNPNIGDSEYDFAFSTKDLLKDENGKEQGRKKLVKDFFGVEVKENTMVVALTARIDEQKGYSYYLGDDGLFEKVFNDPDLDIKFVIAGDPHGIRSESPYIQKLEALQKKYPDKISVNKFSPVLERKFLYYSDFYLGGSLFEPSGLTQMFSQSVGTVPIVSRVGGHVDSVLDGKSGILFDVIKSGTTLNKKATVESNYKALTKAQKLFKNKKEFNNLRSSITKIDNSWGNRVQYFQSFLELAQADFFKLDGSVNYNKWPIDLKEYHSRWSKTGKLCPNYIKSSAGYR